MAQQIIHEADLAIELNEAYQLFMATLNTGKVEGDIAEVGTYQGGSAKLMCEAKGDRKLHIFDTFEGLPDLGDHDDTEQFRKGQYSSQLEKVQEYLSCFEGVHFYKGLFPATAKPVSDCRFSLVHLDVDLYSSTYDCIEFFYPRLSPGAIMLTHDYSYAPGVKKAFDEFFVSKPEPLVVLSGTQCLVVKCSSED